MKAVLDTMLWVSYCTRPDGSRHRLIDRALKAKVRLFVSDYILVGFFKRCALHRSTSEGKSWTFTVCAVRGLASTVAEHARRTRSPGAAE